MLRAILAHVCGQDTKDDENAAAYSSRLEPAACVAIGAAAAAKVREPPQQLSQTARAICAKVRLSSEGNSVHEHAIASKRPSDANCASEPLSLKHGDGDGECSQQALYVTARARLKPPPLR